MIWTDRGTKLKIKYYDIPDKYSYQAISAGIKKFKGEMEQLAFESGVYISLNVVVVKNAKRLILGLMYVNESVVDGVIDEMNALVERMKHDLKECEEVIPSAADNDFNRLIGRLNHTVSDSDTKVLDLGAMKKDEGRMFTGLLMHCDKDISPRELFVLNLLRGSIGDNDTDSTFFEIRKRGDIYSGFSKVFSETGTLLAGCFANYTQEISDEVKERIKDRIKLLSSEPSELDKCKRKYINSFMIMNLEYHKGFVIEPYYRYFNEIKDMEDIKSVLDSITTDDIRLVSEKMRYEDVYL